MQPSVIKMGKALEIVFGLANTILLPIKLLNEKTNILFTKNIKKYEEKIDKIQEENIIPIASEIGMPIIECLTYYQDDQIVDLFAALLLSASDKTKCKYAHPAYINVIKNMSPDEAILIKNISIYRYALDGVIPVSSIRVYKEDNSYRIIDEYFVSEDCLFGLRNVENKSIYFENLQKLGILNYFDNKHIPDKNYNNIDKLFIKSESIYKSKFAEKSERLHNRHCIIQFTNFGLGFLDSIGIIL